MEKITSNIVHVNLWTASERTLLRFKNELKSEGVVIIDEMQGDCHTVFNLRVEYGKCIFLPCKGSVDIRNYEPRDILWRV